MSTRVLVLDGNENQAVACTRALARSGYHVEVGSDEGWSKAGWSRYASGSFRYPSPQEEPDAFVEALRARLVKHGPAVVLPMTEKATLPISARRHVLTGAGGMMVLPPHETLLKVFDKRVMTDLAASLGLTVPRTWQVTSAAELASVERDAIMPVVLKPSSSQEETTAGGSVTTGAPVYARSIAELRTAWQQLSRRASSILVQEFIPGSGAGYFALMVHGKCRGEFAHRRIRDVRPTGSGSALRVSVEPPALMRKQSLALLEAVNWHGVAMVEFRVRPDGQPVFLEINGRFWNSLALAVHAGVDFPTGMARIAESGDTPPLAAGRPGVYSRWLLGDMRHLLSVMRGAPAGFPAAFPSRLATIANVATPKLGTRHDNFELSDPLPAFGDWIHFFFRKAPAAVLGRVKTEAR
jgi:predicted ATP-grasp superfamily ATP-dependent carboligase